MATEPKQVPGLLNLLFAGIPQKVANEQARQTDLANERFDENIATLFPQRQTLEQGGFQVPIQTGELSPVGEQVAAAYRADPALGRDLATRQLLARGLPLNPQEKLAFANADIARMDATEQTLDDLRGEYQKADVVVDGMQALTSWNQLMNLTQNPASVTPQSLGSAIVAVSQIQEPGLAVRKDDRMAYEGGNSFWIDFVNWWNSNVADEAIAPETVNRIIGIAQDLVTPRLEAATQYTNNFGRMVGNKAARVGGNPRVFLDETIGVVGGAAFSEALQQARSMNIGPIRGFGGADDGPNAPRATDEVANRLIPLEP